MRSAQASGRTTTLVRGRISAACLGGDKRALPPQAMPSSSTPLFRPWSAAQIFRFGSVEPTETPTQAISSFHIRRPIFIGRMAFSSAVLSQNSLYIVKLCENDGIGTLEKRGLEGKKTASEDVKEKLPAVKAKDEGAFLGIKAMPVGGGFSLFIRPPVASLRAATGILFP
ncbi:hypothetical protein OPV22_034040 [Ensete ventricosum]|uniref:Uncharacterized protein n=1 Tax=Ensete ventricosum TaxID=4639 RepID=A0AAV8Q3N0_ENSVE|nr:hypothetical protein OPV22_034040 [Ensete ventricosum]